MLAKTNRFFVTNAPYHLNCQSNEVITVELQTHLYNLITLNLGYENSCSLSIQDRKTLSQNNISLTYGEVLFPSCIDIFRKVDAGGVLNFRKFYDLGSGSGKAVLAAALILRNVQYFIGIEQLPNLYQQSLELAKSYKETQKTNPFLISQLEFYHDSFLNLCSIDWTDGDIIFINSTCFGKTSHNDLMSSLNILLERLKVGSYCITFTYQLDEVTSGFHVIDEMRCEMSWGMVDVFIHKKESNDTSTTIESTNTEVIHGVEWKESNDGI